MKRRISREREIHVPHGLRYKRDMVKFIPLYNIITVDQRKCDAFFQKISKKFFYRKSARLPVSLSTFFRSPHRAIPVYTRSFPGVTAIFSIYSQ